MDEKQANDIVKTFTDGIAPVMGEVSPPEESYLDDKMVSDLYYAVEILKQQAGKIDPDTGKILEINSSYDNIQLSGALFQIIEFAKETLPKKPRLKHGRKARLRLARKTHLRYEKPLRPDMAGRSWSDEESKWLIEQFDKGIGILELAIRHQRTKGAIRAQLKRLGKIET